MQSSAYSLKVEQFIPWNFQVVVTVEERVYLLQGNVYFLFYSLQVIAGERGAEWRTHDFGRVDCLGIRYCNGSNDKIR